MSEIKIEANSSGGGVYTLQSGTGSTDRTITLPDATTTLSANMPLGYDSWYLNAAQTSNADITAWTRRTTNYLNIGDAMTVSSGVFTFPSTGIYKIELFTLADFVAATSDQAHITIKKSTDNFSSSNNVGFLLCGPTWVAGHAHIDYMCDVENTTTHKIKFTAGGLDSGSKFAGGQTTYTYVSFTKLGET